MATTLEPPQMSANQTSQCLPATQNPQPSKLRPDENYALLFWKLITKSIHALEKVQVDKSNLDHETKLFINVDVNKNKKTMSIIDNGIGMTKADLEKELCTKDGTHGVLCSAFLDADKVLVTTKHNEDKQYVCEASRGDHCFKIDRDDSETCSLGRGTKISLFLEDGHLGYLEECFLKGLVDTFFRYIDYDITIRSYDFSDKYPETLVHASCSEPQFSYWYRLRPPYITTLENYLLESFPDEVDARKKRNEKKTKSFEEKEKGLESLRKVIAKVLINEVDKVVMLESRDSPETNWTVSVDPKSEAITMEIDPWEPDCIWEKLAELAAENSDKYYNVLKKMIHELFTMTKPLKDCSHRQQGPEQPVHFTDLWAPELPVHLLLSHKQPFSGKDLFFKRLVYLSIRALDKVKKVKEKKLFIYVDVNKICKTLSVIDNGIGITKAGLEKDRFGLLLFLEDAKKIMVMTKHKKDEHYVCVASRGDKHFKIDRDDTSTSSLGSSRGTKITLFFEDDHFEYLDMTRLQDLVDSFFRFINYEITIRYFDSSNMYRSGLVHSSCAKPVFSSWERVILLSTTSENCSSESEEESFEEFEKFDMLESTPEKSSLNEGVIRTMSELTPWCHKPGEMRFDFSCDHEESESKLKSFVRHVQEAHRCCVQILKDKHKQKFNRSRMMSELILCCYEPGEMCCDLSEESESKLESFVRNTQEAHRCVQILIDELKLDDTQKELVKFHLDQKDPFSSSGVKNEERTSAPSCGPKKGTNTPSDGQDHQQQQQVAPPRPQMAANQTPQFLSAEKQWKFVRDDIFFKKLIIFSICALEKVKGDDETKLFIHVDLNKTYKTMSITDDGIGMTKAVLENDDTHGVLSFFFLAANMILVTTKHKKNQQYFCEASPGKSCFKIDRDNTSTRLDRGTKITLFLKDDHLEYLEERRLQGLVDNHFRFIDYEITIRSYDSSNMCVSGLVHSSCSKPPLSSWYKVETSSTISSAYSAEEVEFMREEMNEKKRRVAKK